MAFNGCSPVYCGYFEEAASEAAKSQETVFFIKKTGDTLSLNLYVDFSLTRIKVPPEYSVVKVWAVHNALRAEVRGINPKKRKRERRPR